MGTPEVMDLKAAERTLAAKKKREDEEEAAAEAVAREQQRIARAGAIASEAKTYAREAAEGELVLAAMCKARDVLLALAADAEACADLLSRWGSRGGTEFGMPGPSTGYVLTMLDAGIREARGRQAKQKARHEEFAQRVRENKRI